MEAIGAVGEGNRQRSFSWRAKPSKDPKKMVTVLLCAFGAFFLGIGLVQSVLVGLVGLLAVLGSTAEIWLGTKYSLDEMGAQSARGASVTRLYWKDVQECQVLPRGVRLLPVSGTSRLAPFRGIFLQFDGVGKDELIAKIHELGGPDVSSMA